MQRRENSRPPYRKDDSSRPSRSSDNSRREGSRSGGDHSDSPRSDKPFTVKKASPHSNDRKDNSERRDNPDRRSSSSRGKEGSDRRTDSPYKRSEGSDRRSDSGEKRSFSVNKSSGGSDRSDRNISVKKNYHREEDGLSSERKFHRESTFKSKYPDKAIVPAAIKVDDGTMRLNRYIAHAGICSRRQADVIITSGAIKINGVVVTELGFKVQQNDVVHYGDQLLSHEKKVYVLLNKPKDFITTLEDDRGRRTVFELIKNACNERIYPVGRLDRQTTGLLLFTNDGDMATKLTHPKHRIKKVYHVTLDKKLSASDMRQIAEGITLDDGFIKVDEINYVETCEDKKEVGVELHSGRNRIVRRVFEQLGYEVVKLDRVVFAGLTKKDIPRGHWRVLTEKEIGFLKMIQ